MDVASVLLARAAERGHRSLMVVGTGKNVGKTVTARALASSAAAAGGVVGFTSLGRDGEMVDAATAGLKPRLFFSPGTLLATAADSLRGVPAPEILDLWNDGGPLGRTVIARVRTAAAYEVAGPNTAAGIRFAVEGLFAHGAATVVIDGAIDRMAALGGGDDAVILACGAARGGTLAHVAEEARTVVARLTLPRFEPGDALVHGGAFTEEDVERFIAAGETRQIVIDDPTKLVVRGRLIERARNRLRLRVRRALDVIACTVSSIDRERSFDVHAALRAVAEATGLPAYDVFAGACVA